MNKENIRRRIRNVTAFAAALLLAAAFTFPAELGDGFFDGFGNAIVASAAGSSGTCGTNLTWRFDGTDTLTISGTGEMDKWTNVSKVPWSDYSRFIKSVIIENGVTSIGNNAFNSCIYLESIDISDSVTSIGNNAFSSCMNLTSLTIPDSVKLIDYSVFFNCTRLESIFLPNTLDVSISGIRDEATRIRYTVDNKSVTITSVTLGSGQTSVTIPETIGGKTVTSIGDNAFEDCTSLTSITIPSGVTSIGNSAFKNCSSLTSITIPDSVTSIGDHAFYYCTSLTSITIPYRVTSIGEYAFYYCRRLTSITIPSSVTSIGKYAFYNCYNLTSITIPNSVTSIGDYAFEYCSKFTSITIPSSVNSIGIGAFHYCDSLESIFLPESLSEIGAAAIPETTAQVKYTVDTDGNVTITSVTLGSGQTSVTIPDTIDGKTVTVVFTKDGTNISAPSSATQIKYTVDNSNNATITGATPGEGVTSVTIPDTIDGKTVTSIGDSAFSGCSSLTSITIPNGVTLIGHYAFKNCSSLTSITIPDGVTSIGNSAFSGCKSLTSIAIPDSVISIGKYAFEYCENLATVSFGENSQLSSINSGLFYSCSKLTSITIPDGVIRIEPSAFNGCSSLRSITIPDSVTFIGNHAFYCTSLTSITIPGSVNSIGNYAFCDCRSLTSITIPDSVTSIGESAFYNCTSLTSITIPNGVTSIGDEAFIYCYSLKSIFLPERLTSIGTDAIPASATQIRYTVDNENVTITAVTLGGGQSSFTIPSTIDGKTVTAVCIKDGAIGIDIPASATQIRYTVDNENVTITAVTLGSGQTSVTIPDTIGGKAVTVVFTKDGTNISAPSSATQIKYTVSGDNVTVTGVTLGGGQSSFTIPSTIDGKTVTAVCIKDGATGIDIPASVTQIRYTVDNENVTINKGTLGEGQTSLTIPDTIDGKTVTSIGITAFKDCTSLASITIPNGVTSIGDSAFRSCTNLTSITIPDSVNSIGNYAFRSCSNLTSITIPDSVTSIGEYAFYYCTSLKSITIPGSVNSIGNNAFKYCSSLTSIFLPERLNSIGTDAIPTSAAQIRYTVDNENVTITAVTLGEGQTSLTIPETIGGKAVTNIADGALASCPNVTHEHRAKTAATCTEKAVCAICETGYGETEAHSLTKHDAVPASCTTDGNIEYYECSVCDKLFTGESGTTETTLEAVTILATGHSFGIACDSNAGGHYYVCTVCDEKSDIEEHIKDNGTVIKEATLTESGIITYMCTVCCADMGDETITATISSFDVTSSGVVVKYTVTGSTAVKSQTLKFSEVTEEMVELMKSKDIKLVIDFVNYSTAGSDTIILTAAQMKAIEYVLEHDFGM